MNIKRAFFSSSLLLAAGVTVAGCSGGSQPTEPRQDVNIEAVGTASLPLSASVDGQLYRLSPASFTFESLDDPDFLPRTVSGNGSTDSVTTNLPIGTYNVRLEDGWVLKERVRRTDGSTYYKTIPATQRTLTSPNPQQLTITEYGTANAVFTFAVGEGVIQFGEGKGGVSVDVDDCDGGSQAAACGDGACVDDSDCYGSQVCDLASAVCRDVVCEAAATVCDGHIARECSADGFSYATAGDDCTVDGDVCTRGACAEAVWARRASVSSSGSEGNGHNYWPQMSPDGRYVVFESTSSNLVPWDTNEYSDVFIHDTDLGTTKRVSVSSQGVEANADCEYPSVSADGRFVVFQSGATNLVAGDMNGRFDVFVHDTLTGETSAVSVDSTGAIADGPFGGGESPRISANGRFVAFSSRAALTDDSREAQSHIFVRDLREKSTMRVSRRHIDSWFFTGWSPSISGDGRYVAYGAYEDDVVPGDTNGVSDVFVYDVEMDTTIRASVATTGEEGNGESGRSHYSYEISGDGRFVAFTSAADNLVPNDTNGEIDVFVHDLRTRSTMRVSVSSTGEEADGESLTPSLSADGRFVSFDSSATNLAEGSYYGGYIHDIQKRATTFTRNRAFDLSSDGRFVTGVTYSALAGDDTNGKSDIYLIDTAVPAPAP